MAAFGHLDGPKAGVRDCAQVNICGGTDNRSTPAVQKKGLSTKWPLFGFQMRAHSAMNDVNKRLVLNWRPREENSYADDLTITSSTRPRKESSCVTSSGVSIIH